MPDYPSAGHDGTELQEKISAKHDAVVAAFGRPAAPYVYQEYPKVVSKSVDGVKVETTVYTKAQEDSFIGPSAEVEPSTEPLPPPPPAPDPATLVHADAPVEPEPPVLSSTE